MAAQPAFQLYTTALPADLGPAGKQYMSKGQYKRIPIIYHSDIDPNNTGQIDYALLGKAIQQKIPNSNETGICILDWEGPQFEFLKHGVIAQDSMAAIVRKFKDMLFYARQLRPKARWGIYDMPVTTYWVGRDTSWATRKQLLMPLLQKVDVLCPSIYDFFQTGSYDWMDDPAYFSTMVQRSLQLGSQLQKPVLPFIWHRYHDATEKVGLLCVNEQEFTSQLRQMLNVSQNGRYLDGLIWWHEDGYYYTSGDQRIMREAQDKTKNQYLDAVIPRYAKLIEQTVQQWQEEVKHEP
jgi:hypothetical protein